MTNRVVAPIQNGSACGSMVRFYLFSQKNFHKVKNFFVKIRMISSTLPEAVSSSR